MQQRLTVHLVFSVTDIFFCTYSTLNAQQNILPALNISLIKRKQIQTQQHKHLAVSDVKYSF